MQSKARVVLPALVGVVIVGTLVGVLATRDGDLASDAERSRTSTTSVVALARADLGHMVEASGFGDPASIEIPPVADGDTLGWLDGDGRAAVEMVTVIEPLWAEGVSACETTAESLDSVGSPEQLAAAAAGVPDGPTQEILLGLHTATRAVLNACTDLDAFERARAELAWQWALADRRMNETGVER